MSAQQSLFGAANLAATVAIPPVPQLTPHTAWPFPGMSPQASAQAAMSRSEAYSEMLASVIKQRGDDHMTTKQVLAAIPKDWREICGKYAHATLPSWTAKKHGIESTYVPHDDGGFHFSYRAAERIAGMA